MRICTFWKREALLVLPGIEHRIVADVA